MFKDLLKDLNVTKKNLASILNVSPRMIEFWENSNTMPEKKVLQKIERIFKIDLSKYNHKSESKEIVQAQESIEDGSASEVPVKEKITGSRGHASKRDSTGTNSRRVDIRQLRKDQGLTQQEFADKVGVSRNTVSQWETGKKSPTFKYMKRMEELFKINLSAFRDQDRSGTETSSVKSSAPNLNMDLDLDDDSSLHRNFSVRMLRQQLRMSQKHFAQRIGVSQQLVSKWETAEVKINQRNLRLLAEAFPEETHHLPFLSKQMPDIDIGELLRKYNLTQGELARKLNVSKQIVSQWILNRTKPGPKNMEKIIRLFNIESPLNNIPPDLGIKVIPKGPDDIRGIRLAYNLSQKEFAKRIGFSSQTVSNWETGRLKPGKKARRKIASIFPIEELNGSIQQPILSEPTSSIGISGLPPMMESWVQGRKDVFIKIFENKPLVVEDIFVLPSNQMTLVCERGSFVFSIQISEEKKNKLKENL